MPQNSILVPDASLGSNSEMMGFVMPNAACTNCPGFPYVLAVHATLTTDSTLPTGSAFCTTAETPVATITALLHLGSASRIELVF